MAWFKLESTFRDHRKVKRLARELKIDVREARGILVGLFCRVCDESPDGSLTDWSDTDIADAADWPEKSATELVAALCLCGWIDTDDGAETSEIHGWMERAEGYKAAQRARTSREKKRTARVRTRTARVRDSHVPACGMSRREDGEERRGRRGRRGEEKNTITRGASRADTKNDDVCRVVDHYREVHPGRGKHLKPGHRDWKRIASRLAEGFSVDDLCKAIDGNKRDEWHQQASAGHTIEYIFRNATKVESFTTAAVPKKPSWMQRSPEMQRLIDEEEKEIFDAKPGNNSPEPVSGYAGHVPPLLPGREE